MGYAIIETGGKQYRVTENEEIFIEKLDVKAGDKVVFDKTLLVSSEAGVVIGTPTVAGATVEGEVISQVKGHKITVYKYKSKKNERKKQGHRQPYTRVKVTKISA